MISTIVLVRHGENEASAKGLLAGDMSVGLTERGREQAKQTAKRLSSLQGAVPGAVPIISSPLPRTLETAWFIAEALGVAPEIQSAFTEFPVGPWSGRSMEDLRQDAAFRTYVQDPLKYPMGSGAFVQDVADRVDAGINKVLHAGRGPLSVIVTHGGIIRLCLVQALGMSIMHYNRLQCDEGSISIIRYRPNAVTDPTWPRVVQLNEMPSLSGA
jgi:ribonuclease H / adenosylcobalamin/alpha-ribazole phosphatase